MSDFGGGLFTGPYFKALAAKSFIESLKTQKEDREYQREQRRMALEQQQRQNQLHDAQFTMALQSMGAIPAEQGATNRIDQIMQQAASIEPENRRQIIQTPMGQYRLPNQGDRQQRQIADSTAAGTAKGYEIQATEKITNPYVKMKVPDELGGGETEVPRKEQGDILLRMQALLEKKTGLTVHPPVINKETGDATFYGTDGRGNVSVVKTIPRIGGIAASAGKGNGYIPDYEGQTKRLMDEWRGVKDGKVIGGFYGSHGITQNVYDAATGAGKYDDVATFGSPKLNRQAASQRLGVVEKELAAGVEKKIRNDAKAPGATSSAGKPATAKREPVKASQLNDLLNRTNTKRAASGQTPLTINSLRKLLIERQVQIDDAQ